MTSTKTIREKEELEGAKKEELKNKKETNYSANKMKNSS